MQLFALMDSQAATKILRIQIDSKTETELTSIFDTQAATFKSHHNTIIDFYAGYKPSYSECFQVKNFKEASSLHDAVLRNTAIPVWDPKVIPISHIKAIFTGNPKTNELFIQTFDKRQILDIAKSLIFSSNVFTMSSSVGFNIDDKLTAIVTGDIIHFKSFKNLRRIFDMDLYFCEATDAELKDFSACTTFKIPDGFDIISIADTPVRTKVALINKSNILNTVSISTFKRVATEINFDLKVEDVNGKELIIMPSVKKELKLLLSFLDQDIYQSGLTKTIFKSNSKRPL